jgi:hypothetical protein
MEMPSLAILKSREEHGVEETSEVALLDVLLLVSWTRKALGVIAMIVKVGGNDRQ